MPNLTKRNRELMFWLIQLLGWGGLYVFYYVATLMAQQPGDILRTIPLVALAGFLASTPLRYVCRWLWRLPLRKMVMGGLLAALVAAVSWRVCTNLIYEMLAPGVVILPNWTAYFTGITMGMCVMTCWVGLYFGFRCYESLQDQSQIALRATRSGVDMPLLTKRNRELMFWLIQSLAWSGLFVSYYFGTVMAQQPGEILRTIPLISLSGFLISTPLRYVCRRLWKLPLLKMITGAVLAAFIAAATWRVCVNLVYLTLAPSVIILPGWASYFTGITSGMCVMTCWVGLYFGFRYYESLQDQSQIALRATALAQQAQLKMLRYQLNPHFLFNTLNGISTLILDNRNGIANRAVTALADFLRYTLEQDPMKRVTLAQELDAINLYLEIEKLRFGPRLAVLYLIEEPASRALVPSLLLQPLIENAIKYAVSPREQGGTIRVEGRVQQGMLQLTVRDDGPGIAAGQKLGESRGVGIRNTCERLQVLYRDYSRMTVSNAEPGLSVLLQFPAELVEVQPDPAVLPAKVAVAV